MTQQRYINRQDAGKRLAQHLLQYQHTQDTIVLALPRGGVPVAHEIAYRLHLPLDVYIVKKLGVPWHPELAMGALASDQEPYINHTLVKELSIVQSAIDETIAKARQEVTRRETLYRRGKKSLILRDQTIILVDDGIATGATIKAALAALRLQHPKKIICAVPVAAPDSIEALQKLADAIICPLQPDNLDAIGLWYEAFEQTTDEEVISILSQYP